MVERAEDSAKGYDVNGDGAVAIGAVSWRLRDRRDVSQVDGDRRDVATASPKGSSS